MRQRPDQYILQGNERLLSAYSHKTCTRLPTRCQDIPYPSACPETANQGQGEAMRMMGLGACVPAVVLFALSGCTGSSDSSSAGSQAKQAISIQDVPAATTTVGA